MFFWIFFHGLDEFLNQFRRLLRIRQRFTASAGTKRSQQRLLCRFKEFTMFKFRLSSGTCWAAKYAGGFHADEENTFIFAVFSQQSLIILFLSRFGDHK